MHVIWECELKKDAIEATMAKLLPELADELGKELTMKPILETLAGPSDR